MQKVQDLGGSLLIWLVIFVALHSDDSLVGWDLLQCANAIEANLDELYVLLPGIWVTPPW